VEVLKRRGWVELRIEKLSTGARRCNYRIVFQDLCRLTRLPLWVDKPVAQIQEPVAQCTEPVAPQAEPVAHAGNPVSVPESDPLEAHQENERTNGSGDDNGEYLFLKERANRFFSKFPGGRDPLTRERVLRILLLEYRGVVQSGTFRDIVRDLSAPKFKKRGAITDLRALLYRMLLNRGYDVDKLRTDVPNDLIVGIAQKPLSEAEPPKKPVACAASNSKR
jgi:hypothetical protein